MLFKENLSPMTFEDVVSSSMIYQSLFSFLNEEKELYIENDPLIVYECILLNKMYIMNTYYVKLELIEDSTSTL